MSVAHRGFLRKGLVKRVLKTKNIEKIQGTKDNKVKMHGLFTCLKSVS